MPQIYNVRNHDAPPDAVWVDRRTLFGNKFRIGIHGTRKECMRLYREWVYHPLQKDLRNFMRAHLKGKDLKCWCVPLDCHATVILDIANSPMEK